MVTVFMGKGRFARLILAERRARGNLLFIQGKCEIRWPDQFFTLFEKCKKCEIWFFYRRFHTFDSVPGADRRLEPESQTPSIGFANHTFSAFVWFANLILASSRKEPKRGL